MKSEEAFLSPGRQRPLGFGTLTSPWVFVRRPRDSNLRNVRELQDSLVRLDRW